MRDEKQKELPAPITGIRNHKSKIKVSLANQETRSPVHCTLVSRNPKQQTRHHSAKCPFNKHAPISLTRS
jgi:hypothetical protein